MTLQEYLEEHYTAETVKAYLYEISHYTTSFNEAASASYKEVVQYVGSLRTRYNNAYTLNRILCSIKAYYAYLCHTEQRSDNPAKSIRLRDARSRDVQLQDLFTAEELEALLQRKERFTNLYYRNRVLISLLIYQALTLSEIEAVKLSCIDLAAGTITIGTRKLSLKPNQILLFYEYIQDIRPKLLDDHISDYLLIGQRGAAMSGPDVSKHITRSYKDLYPGRKINAQTIRQSVITNLLKQGHDISLVQYFAGHTYPSSTERYKQDEVETLQAAVNKYHPIH